MKKGGGDFMALNHTLETLQQFMTFSIIVSAVVVLFVFLCVLYIYHVAKKEKQIEQLRWLKVSAEMELFDCSARVVYPLEADEILVGRHGSADIRLNDMSVSRYHAILYVSNGVWSVRDLNSKSGTYVNGHRITKQVKLRPQDEIQFGNKATILKSKRRGGRYGV